MERKKEIKKVKEGKKESEGCRYKTFPHTKPVYGGDMREAETDRIF